jgi:hypothetical protein
MSGLAGSRVPVIHAGGSGSERDSRVAGDNPRDSRDKDSRLVVTKQTTENGR